MYLINSFIPHYKYGDCGLSSGAHRHGSGGTGLRAACCKKSDCVVLGPYGLQRERESVALLSSLTRLVCEHVIRGTCWGLTRWSQVG